MRNSCREEIRELALQEMLRMKAQTDTKTTVVVSSNPYPYPGLLSDPSAIRLVVLLPSVEKHADIVCVLCNGALSRSESDQYEALSYVWGDSLKRRPITVSNQQFQATENLELALRHLRQRDRPRVLWIDSLCINQNDVAESNAKVQQLDRIYRKWSCGWGPSPTPAAMRSIFCATNRVLIRPTPMIVITNSIGLLSRPHS